MSTEDRLQNDPGAARRPVPTLAPAAPVPTETVSGYVRQGQRLRAEAVAAMFAALAGVCARALRRMAGRDRALSGNGLPARS